MFRAEKRILEKDKIHQYTIFEKDNQLKFVDFISYLIENEAFRYFYNQTLAKSEFEGFFWENPSSSSENLHQDYGFVLVRSDIFSNIEADAQTFSKYFTKTESAVTFPNLSKNARLIVPTPESSLENYTHLANFVRQAPTKQTQGLWKLVGETFKHEMNQGKRWLSTHGLGVHWLHIRVDMAPKYYHFKSYKEN